MANETAETIGTFDLYYFDYVVTPKGRKELSRFLRSQIDFAYEEKHLPRLVDALKRYGRYDFLSDNDLTDCLPLIPLFRILAERKETEMISALLAGVLGAGIYRTEFLGEICDVLEAHHFTLRQLMTSV